MIHLVSTNEKSTITSSNQLMLFCDIIENRKRGHQWEVIFSLALYFIKDSATFFSESDTFLENQKYVTASPVKYRKCLLKVKRPALTTPGRKRIELQTITGDHKKIKSNWACTHTIAQQYRYMNINMRKGLVASDCKSIKHFLLVLQRLVLRKVRYCVLIVLASAMPSTTEKVLGESRVKRRRV
ncbi:hypothetical protein AVEN_123824-1 [Araneus ventricosus]|uniref:Uncharacterized protein n=1 Tax=Araneus ventricosus TaxID=182803 RepID=A0A4Y2LLT5_ARAVE|nr:hypothetical protein AVEN_123824-1 [Araneus ventricosus]